LIDALQRVIAVLKAQSHDRTQNPALIHVAALKNLSLIPDNVKREIVAFMQQAGEDIEGLRQMSLKRALTSSKALA